MDNISSFCKDFKGEYNRFNKALKNYYPRRVTYLEYLLIRIDADINFWLRRSVK